MARKLWTAAEMDQLTRDQQQAVFEESIVSDLDTVPAKFLEQIRADAERLVASLESRPTD